MKTKMKTNFVFSLFLIFILLAVSFNLPQAEALTPDEERTYNEIHANDNVVTNFFASLLRTASLAGRQRQCSDYPDRVYQGYNPDWDNYRAGLSAGNNFWISHTQTALANLYWVSGSTWTFFTEREVPPAFNWQANQNRAVEIYECEAIPDECSGAERTCVTETSYKKCVDGRWSDNRRCGSDEICDSGRCKTNVVDDEVCNEQWTCKEWRECTADGIQYRSCTDNNNCGTTSDIPPTSQSCDPDIKCGDSCGSEDIPPTNDLGGDGDDETAFNAGAFFTSPFIIGLGAFVLIFAFTRNLIISAVASAIIMFGGLFI